VPAPVLKIRPFDAPPAVELDALPADVLAFYGRRSAPEWAWLSNFEGGPVEMPDPHTGKRTTYPSKEHALMCHKTVSHDDHEWIRAAKEPKHAKSRGGPRGERGRKIELRSDWDEIKLGVMVEILRHWYAANPAYADHLRATGDRLIVEDSPQDAIWGIRSRGGRFAGTNLLGRAHMAVRAELS
jgi:N-glycosidase YbiA